MAHIMDVDSAFVLCKDVFVHIFPLPFVLSDTLYTPGIYAITPQPPLSSTLWTSPDLLIGPTRFGKDGKVRRFPHQDKDNAEFAVP